MSSKNLPSKPGHNTRTERQKIIDRALIADYLKRGFTIAEMARQEALSHISYNQIRYDAEKLLKDHQEETTLNMRLYATRQNLKIEAVIQEALLGYENSKKEKIKEIEKSGSDLIKGDWHENIKEKTKSVAGDPSYLKIVLSGLDQQNKLAGAYKNLAFDEEKKDLSLEQKLKLMHKQRNHAPDIKTLDDVGKNAKIDFDENGK
jgi:hypothetical protein